MTYIRWKAGVDNLTPYDDTTLLPIVNIAKNEIAQAIIEKNTDYFGEIATFNTVSAQGEYTNPSDLMLFKRIEVSYSGTSVGSYTPARFVTSEDMTNGEDWHAANASTSAPVVIADDTGFRLYPNATTSTFGPSYAKIYYVPFRPDFSSLAAATDITTLTGIGPQFHHLIGDKVINLIREKQGIMTLQDVRLHDEEIKDSLQPAAYRNISMPVSDTPSDRHLQY